MSNQGNFFFSGVRQTSIAAYRQIADEGLLGRMQLEAYQALYQHGPATASELNAQVTMRHVHPRLHELVKMGVAREAGKRKCRVTGRETIVYDVTDKLPEKPERKQRRQHCATCTCYGR